jgi:hypothetical protein
MSAACCNVGFVQHQSGKCRYGTAAPARIARRQQVVPLQPAETAVCIHVDGQHSFGGCNDAATSR